MKVITLTHQKGGVGKSTLALNLAHAFKGHVHTALLDLDPQGSILQIKNKIEGIDVLTWKSADFDNLPYNVIFIDTPPYFSDKLPEILEKSDLVLIPITPSVFDVIACDRTISLIKQAQRKKPGGKPKAGIILNHVNNATVLTKEARDLLIKFKVPVLESQVSERMNFIRSTVLPNGIYSTKDRKAIDEINNLTKETLFLLNNL